MDIAFIGKDGRAGMKATLTYVKYNNRYNFNLVSLTRLLMNGWKVTKGDKTGITIGNKDCNEIKIDIVIPTVCGTIFACRFIQDADIYAVSTVAGTTMNIEKVHRLLGHGDEELTWQMEKHLHWVIT